MQGGIRLRTGCLTRAIAAALVLQPLCAHAHSNHSRVAGVWQAEANPDAGHAVYGGYGYIAGSEADAYEALNFGCEREEQVSYFQQACGPSTPVPSGSAASLVDSAMRALIVSDLRRHETEYLMIQNKALGGAAPAVPNCLVPDAELAGLHAALPAVQPTFDEVQAAPAASRNLLNRSRIATAPLRSGELVRALIFSDQIESNWSRYCNGSTTNSFCTDLANQRRRIQTSFPALFRPGPGLARNELRLAIQQLLGSRFPDATTDSDRQSRGALQYAGLVSASGPDRLNELERAIAEALMDGRSPPSGQSAAITSALQGANNRMSAAVETIRQGYGAAVTAALGGVCSRSTIDDYVRNSPNLVRQMLNDASPRRRALARLVLCQSPELHAARRERSCEGVSAFRSGPHLDTRVVRQEWNFPYTSDINYTIVEPRRPPANAPAVIRTTMHVRVDAGMDSGQADAQIQQMRAQSNAYFNCMTGQSASMAGVPGLSSGTTCPPDPAMADPPVRFEIEILRTPPAPNTPPVVDLHECYNAEMAPPDDRDCDAVRRHAITQCANNIRLWQRQGFVGGAARQAPDMEEFLTNIRISPIRPAPAASSAASGGGGSGGAAQPDYLNMDAAAIKRHCNDTNPPATDGRYNREDAGNYTRNTSAGTVIHEVGHVLGLPDEYQDPTYPFLPQGEHDSVMNNSSNPNATLRPRHILRMLDMRECVRSTRRRLGGSP